MVLTAKNNNIKFVDLLYVSKSTRPESRFAMVLAAKMLKSNSSKPLPEDEATSDCGEAGVVREVLPMTWART